MKFFLSIVLYLVVLLSFLQDQMLLMIGALIIYSAMFNAVSFIPAAILFDGYFGNYYTFPYLSFMAIGWFVATEYFRPKMIDIVSRDLWAN